MHLQAAKRWQGALIFLFSAATGLFAKIDTLGPYIWATSPTNAEVYACVHFGSPGSYDTVNSHPAIDGVPLPYGSIIAAFDTLGNCIGASRWESGTISVAVQEYSSAGVVVPGLNPGQKFRFALWDSVTGAQVTSVYAHFAALDQSYGLPNADSLFVASGTSWLDTLRGYSSPALALPSNGAGDQTLPVNLSWSSVLNAASYAVMVSTSSSFSTTVFNQTGLTALSATLSSLANSTTYYWMTAAANPTNSSGVAWSGVWSFTTASPTLAPVAPSLTSPTNASGNQPISSLGLSWSTSAGATSYEVEVSTSNTFSTTIFDQTGPSLTSSTVSGLMNNASYYWRANASNIGGTSWSSTWSFTTIVATPGVPVLSSPSNGVTGQAASLTLSWSTATGAASYSVLISTSSTFTTTISSQTGLTGLSAAISGLTYGETTYYWQAGATNAAGTNWASAWSFTTAIEAAPGVPSLTSPTNASINQPISSLGLSWSTSAGATSYEVEVSTSNTFSSTIFDLTGTSLTSSTLNDLSNKATYYWRANASNIGGTSWSAVWSFTTIIATPGAPTLTSPSSGSTNLSTAPTLSWGTVTGAATYNVLVSTSTSFTTTVSSQTGVAGLSVSESSLANNTIYYWEVSATNAGGTGTWSAVWSFTTSTTSILQVAAAKAAKIDFAIKGEALVYSLNATGPVEITFSDLLGRTVLSMKRTMPAGYYTMALKSLSLAAGQYTVRFKAGAFEKQAGIMLTR
jgi:hypothetical protein